MPNKNSVVRNKLYYLIELLLQKEFVWDIKTFCEKFDQVYNSELKFSCISDKERSAFKHIFDKSRWYLQFEKTGRIPHPLDELDFRQTIKEIYRDLKGAETLSPRKKLYWLIDQFQKEEMDAETFSGWFEHTYNLELKKSDLTEQEQLAFRQLFDKVVWYSPFPEERKQIPNYLGEEDIRTAVIESKRKLDDYIQNGS